MTVSTLARLGLAAEHPDRKRDRRVNPFSLAIAPFAGCPPMTNKEYTLSTLAAELDAKAFEEWQRARQDVARAILKGEDGPGTWHGAAVARQGAALIGSLLYGLEPSEAEQHRRKAADALEGLQFLIGDALAADYEAEGMIGPDATVRVVPREFARQLTVDLAGNTLTTMDGAYVWRAVVVRRRGGPVDTTQAEGDNNARDRSRRGKPGSGNVPYDSDADLVARALKGMEAHEYKSANAAAWAMVAEIEGGGSAESKVRRLAAKIRDADPNP